MQTKHFAAGLINVNRHPIVMEVHWKVLHGPPVSPFMKSPRGPDRGTAVVHHPPRTTRFTRRVHYWYPTKLCNFLIPASCLQVVHASCHDVSINSYRGHDIDLRLLGKRKSIAENTNRLVGNINIHNVFFSHVVKISRIPLLIHTSNLLKLSRCVANCCFRHER